MRTVNDRRTSVTVGEALGWRRVGWYRLSLGLILVGILTAPGIAQQSELGSLLVMPEFDNRQGGSSILTVTNVHPTEGIETVWVYLEEDSCEQFNKTEYLGPMDTLTLYTAVHNPFDERGFVYVYAERPGTQDPVSFDWLTGACMTINGNIAAAFSARPFVFKAGVAHGENTDLDGDGVRDLNGLEYQMVPDELLLPRFLGQQYSSLETDLILINLTGSVEFDVSVNIDIWNDNSEQFSAEHTFECWERVPLLGVDAMFLNWYLASTDHAPMEILGDPLWEAGWLSIDGAHANSTEESILDPAVLVFLVERIDEWESGVAPFGRGLQNNGGLHHLDSELDLEPGVGFCFGDPGEGTPCPCNNDNDGSIPGSGCDNGVFASGANLYTTGQARVSVDTLALVTTHADPNNACLFFQGNNRVNGGDGITYGDGLRCAGGGILRLQVTFSNGAGRTRTTIALGATVGAEPGDLSRYQCWYRSTMNPACGPVSFFNTSNGYELVWMP